MDAARAALTVVTSSSGTTEPAGRPKGAGMGASECMCRGRCPAVCVGAWNWGTREGCSLVPPSSCGGLRCCCNGLLLLGLLLLLLLLLLLGLPWLWPWPWP